MDYEKKHKGEVIRATQLWECGDITRENLEYIFPELAESEDERIRKAIIKFLIDVNNGAYTKSELEIASWIAWLEKQRQEPKKVSIWKHWKDGIAGNGNGEQIFLTKIGNIYSISSCLGCECDYIELSELDNLLSDKQEPKPKWSEEDERHYTTIIKALHSSGAITPIDMELAEKWFKSLKKMMEEQQ